MATTAITLFLLLQFSGSRGERDGMGRGMMPFSPMRKTLPERSRDSYFDRVLGVRVGSVSISLFLSILEYDFLEFRIMFTLVELKLSGTASHIYRQSTDRVAMAVATPRYLSRYREVSEWNKSEHEKAWITTRSLFARRKNIFPRI